LINLDHVGDFGSRTDDVVLLGKCDDVVRDLCKELGWEDELVQLWAETEDSVITDAPSKEKKPTPSKKEGVKGDVLVEIEEQFTKLTVAEEPAETLLKESELSEGNNVDKSAMISPVGDADKADKV
jgi:NAD-dependent histone deacetylase SIR2